MKHKKLTLIELMITILVLGLLAALAIPQFTGAKANADVASFKNDIDTLAKAMDESYVKDDNLPLGEKVVITDPALLDTIYATGDSAANLYKIDLTKSSKYHSKLKSKIDADSYFIYSMETGKVFYTKPVKDGEGQILYTMEYVGLSNVLLGSTPLISGMSVPVTEPIKTITGEVPASSTVEVKVNGTDLPVTTEDVVFEGNMALLAGIKTKTFTTEALLSEGVNTISIKVDSQVTNFKINLGESTSPVTPIIKPIAVISMTPDQAITTSTTIVWRTENSTATEGRTITATEWEGKQDLYATEGVYIVKLRVQDSTGIWSDWVEKSITVISMNGVKEIVASSNHTLLLMDDGTVMSFGNNYYGQLGRAENNATNNANPIPTIIEGISGIKSIAAGNYCTLLLKEDGTVLSFGRNNFGQLGRTANSTANPVPMIIDGISGVKSIETGDSHTLLLKEDGAVMSFGYNYYGQLGRTSNIGKNFANPTPTIIPSVSGVKSISAGYLYTLLLMEDGTVMSFGYNEYGQLGKTENSGTTNTNPTPTIIFGVSGVKSVSAGYYHSLILKEDGTVMSFGDNRYGQLGRTKNNGINTANPTPTIIDGVSGIKSVSAGSHHTLLLKEDGSVMSFGWNYYGQLGKSENSGTYNANPIPTIVSGVSGVNSITVGDSHTLLLTEDGTVFSFGYNQYGQLGITSNSETTNANPIPTEIFTE